MWAVCARLAATRQGWPGRSLEASSHGSPGRITGPTLRKPSHAGAAILVHGPLRTRRWARPSIQAHRETRDRPARRMASSLPSRARRGLGPCPGRGRRARASSRVTGFARAPPMLTNACAWMSLEAVAVAVQVHVDDHYYEKAGVGAMFVSRRSQNVAAPTSRNIFRCAIEQLDRRMFVQASELCARELRARLRDPNTHRKLDEARRHRKRRASKTATESQRSCACGAAPSRDPRFEPAKQKTKL